MTVPISESGPHKPAGVQAAVRLALILSFSVLGVAGVYYGALYLIAH